LKKLFLKTFRYLFFFDTFLHYLIMGSFFTSISRNPVAGNLDISNRGVRLESLQEICTKIEAGLLQLPNDEKDRSHGERIRDGLVKPITDTKKCSYAEYLYGDLNTRSLVGKCTTFVSHPWSANFRVTVAAISQYEKNLPQGSPPQFYFVDYLAINQHFPSDDLDELGRMVQSCDTLILMAEPWRNPVVLTRLWCIFEIAQAVLGETEIKIILPPEQEEKFQHSLKNEVMKSVWVFMSKILEQIDSRNAKASMESDIQDIRNFIQDKLGGFMKVDTMVADALRKWFLRSALGLLENFDEAKKGSVEHAELISQVANFHYGLSLHADSARLFGEAAAIFKENGDSKWLICEKEKLYMLRKMGKAQEILPMAIQNLELQVKEFGATAKSTLASKEVVGAVYRELGMNAEAEETLQAILDEYLKDEESYDREIRLAKYQLGWALRNAGKLDKAAQMYQDLIDANTERLGRDDANTLVCVSNYARCLALSMKPERAVPLYEEALPVMRMTWGADDQQVILGTKWLQEAQMQLKSLPETKSQQLETEV